MIRATHAAGRVLCVVLIVSVASCGAGGTEIVAAYGLPDSRRVELSIDTCGATVLSIDVEETADEVRILVETEGGEGPECLDSTVTELDEPLGHRRVIDVSTGEDVEILPAEG